MFGTSECASQPEVRLRSHRPEPLRTIRPHLHSEDAQKRKTKARIIILSLIWFGIWKTTTKKSIHRGFCLICLGFNDDRIIYCYAGGIRCHMFRESGIGFHITGTPLTSFCPPTDQITVYFGDDCLVVNDMALRPCRKTMHSPTGTKRNICYHDTAV